MIALIDCIGKYFLIEKIAFFLIPNICFYDIQIFLFQFPLNLFDYNSTLISKKKYAEHISVNTVRATLLRLC